MAAVTLKVEGGDKIRARLLALAKNLNGKKQLRVGFLEDATYPVKDGVRFFNAADRLTETQKADHPDWEAKLRAWGAWANKNSPMLHVAQVAFWNEFGTVSSPARPFFRQTIAKCSPEWGEDLAGYLRDSELSAPRALRLLGQRIRDQLVAAIQAWPADNAPLTVHIKQFNSGLRDSQVMSRSVDYELVQ